VTPTEWANVQHPPTSSTCAHSKSYICCRHGTRGGKGPDVQVVIGPGFAEELERGGKENRQA
jgi:hypothetical protein